MNIIANKWGSPDGTYFGVKETEPEIIDTDDGQAIGLVNGEGSRRAWGTPRVTSTVVVNTDALVAIHVGYHHKYRGGQFWRYFVAAENQVTRKTWAQLSDDQRSVVLEAVEAGNAPAWANTPGKLRTERAKPGEITQTSYKICILADNGTLHSVFDYATTYALGETKYQPAKADHEGGYYSYLDLANMEESYWCGRLFSEDVYILLLRRPCTLAVVKCQIGGTIIKYGRSGKVASSYLTPVEVIKTFPASECRYKWEDTTLSFMV